MEARINKNKTNVFRIVGSLANRKTWLLVIVLIFSNLNLAEAQCAMCRAVLESSGDNSMAEGINNGIVYLMAVPYLVVAFLIFFVYRKMRN